MKISQEKLAELADVHRNYIGKIERGEHNITINNLCQLAAVFERPLSEIMVDAGL
jgi:transcriptional regulator with XRE-family HTH domain